MMPVMNKIFKDFMANEKDKMSPENAIFRVFSWKCQK